MSGSTQVEVACYRARKTCRAPVKFRIWSHREAAAKLCGLHSSYSEAYVSLESLLKILGGRSDQVLRAVYAGSTYTHMLTTDGCDEVRFPGSATTTSHRQRQI